MVGKGVGICVVGMAVVGLGVGCSVSILGSLVGCIEG